ncbi:STAS domain-containing protein [Streptomyces sp. NPDC050400]|uniref:STAS domain-containing protein n=1 Tax=Streptomyces sp. NPDC050400 TaxID=3365610 RepID=UPI0037A377F7
MRQGNQQDYLSDDFGDHERFADLSGVEDGAPAPVVQTVEDCAVVQLAGEIDLLALHRMAALIETVAAGPYRVVVIDLTATTFFDCSGLTLLVRANRRAAEHGGRVTVVCPHRLTLRIIGLARLTDTLTPVPTLAAALAPEAD